MTQPPGVGGLGLPGTPASPHAAWMAGRRVFAIVTFVGCVVGAITYAQDPAGPGALISAGVSAVLIVATIVGAPLLGARPRKLWRFQRWGALCLLVSLFGTQVSWRVGPVRFTDATYFTGYLCLIIWLALLARHIGGINRTTTVLDTLAATVGASLVLWVTVLAPLVGGAGLPSALVWAVYPTADVLLLALSAHVMHRLGLRLQALRWLLGAQVLLLCLDTVNSLSGMLAPPGEPPAVMACYIFYFFALAMSATHPSLLQLAHVPERPRGRRHGGRHTALIVVTISPAILATSIPLSGFVDSVVRTMLVTFILVLLFLRLSRAMAALSHAESDSRHRATHDQLTGLLNRAALFDTLTDRLERNRRTGRTTALLFLDCDDFKHVNDTWGHSAGDAVLRQIASGLPRMLRAGDLLARHGGDEFVIVATLERPEQVRALAERVQRFFDTPLQIAPHRVHAVSPSIGVVVAPPDDDVDAEALIGHADVAMYEAKQRGRAQYVVFDDELAERTRMRSTVGTRLADALDEGCISLCLQPIMGGPGYREPAGWEALARWHDPVLGHVPPDVFVPLAEQLGLICELGEVVLRRACLDLARLRRAMPDADVAISVNVSPAQLLQPDFAAVVADAVDSAGLPHGCVWLEVTETLLVDEGPAALATLDELRATGVRISIDDFGTGYASLSTLLRLPVDCVKLDRTLVARLGVDPDAERQLGAVIDLVHSLGIEAIVAAGVETPEQVEALIELGCPLVQGWLYGRPSTTEALLAAHAASGHATTSA